MKPRVLFVQESQPSSVLSIVFSISSSNFLVISRSDHGIIRSRIGTVCWCISDHRYGLSQPSHYLLKADDRIHDTISVILAMIIASCVLTNYEVGPKVEACFQNFAAGLILAAGMQW